MLRIRGKIITVIKDSLKYDSNDFPADAKHRVESWLSMLEPNNLPGKLALHVTNPPFEHDEDAQVGWRDLAAERAEKLGVDSAAEWTKLQPLLSSILQGSPRVATSRSNAFKISQLYLKALVLECVIVPL
jgi:hypothetical protein